MKTIYLLCLFLLYFQDSFCVLKYSKLPVQFFCCVYTYHDLDAPPPPLGPGLVTDAVQLAQCKIRANSSHPHVRLCKLPQRHYVCQQQGRRAGTLTINWNSKQIIILCTQTLCNLKSISYLKFLKTLQITYALRQTS